MKKVLFFGIFGIFCTTFGQDQKLENRLNIEKGTWFTAGSISFSSNESKSENLTNFYDAENLGFNLAPKIGFALKRNLVAGVGIDYGRTKYNNSNVNVGNLKTSEFLNQSFNVSPYLRAYKGLGQNIALFLQGEFGYTRGWSEISRSDQSESTSTQNRYSLGIRPGLTYFMSKKLALETSIGNLGFSKFDSDGSNQATSSGSNFNFSLNTSDLFVGVAYYF